MEYLTQTYWRGDTSFLMRKCKSLMRTLGIDVNGYSMDALRFFYSYGKVKIIMIASETDLYERIAADRKLISTQDLYEHLKVEINKSGIDAWWLDLNEGDSVTFTDRFIDENMHLEFLRGQEITITEIFPAAIHPGDSFATSPFFNADYSLYNTNVIGSGKSRIPSYCFNSIYCNPIAKIELEEVSFIKKLGL